MALPVMVGGLHDDRSVFLIDRKVKRCRPLGTLEGVAYAVLDTAEQDWQVYIGHPILLSHPLAGYSLVQIGEKSWSLEIHNPTSQALETSVELSPWFELFGWKGETVAVGPGESVMRIIDA